MGQEARCSVRFGRKASRGKARLEAEALTFSGDFRLSIPFKEIKVMDAPGGQLKLKFQEGIATFDLGALAEKWADKILHPKSRIDKLGVKPGSQVVLLGVANESFRRELREKTTDVWEGRPRKNADLIFLAAKTREDLERLVPLQGYLKKDGAIWVLWLKGKPELKEVDVIAASKKAGLVDVKVVSFSDRESALKLVIPLARR